MNGGGSAFPATKYRHWAELGNHHTGGQPEWIPQSVDGMSLRDYFAAQAVIGIFASGSHRGVASEIAEELLRDDVMHSAAEVGHFAEERIAAMAYSLADAMLNARNSAPAGAPQKDGQ